MAEPAVRGYVNTLISGNPLSWPRDWFKEGLGGRRMHAGLSIGCGTGPLERDLIQRDSCSHIDAFDGSLHSLEVARELAMRAGVADRIHYHFGDFNEPTLPRRRYDIVFFHQSAHHVGKLEKLYRAVLRALKPDGLLYLDEYIGPSRTDWCDDLVRPHRQYFTRIPAEARLFDELPLPIHPDDPSEALRSSEIVPQLEHGFRILEKRAYGGTLLSVIFPAVRWSTASSKLVREMIAAEKQLLIAGHAPYHAIIVATPKRGCAGLYASIRYFFAPKLRRVRWEIMSRLSSEMPKY